MIVSEEEVAVKKFKMFADKATTEAQVFDLCKKYLKHKGIDVDNVAQINAVLATQMAPPKIEKQYVGLADIIQCKAQYVIDDLSVRSIHDDVQQQIFARKNITNLLMQEVVNIDAIKFDEYKDYSRNHLVVHGKLLVYKDIKNGKR